MTWTLDPEEMEKVRKERRRQARKDLFWQRAPIIGGLISVAVLVLDKAV